MKTYYICAKCNKEYWYDEVMNGKLIEEFDIRRPRLRELSEEEKKEWGVLVCDDCFKKYYVN